MTASLPVSSPGSAGFVSRSMLRSRAESSTHALRAMLAGALLVQATSSLGCERELPPATAVAVLVKTELSSDELAHVEFRVNKENDDPDYNKPVSKFTSPVEELNRPFIVTRGHADKFLLSVLGYRRGGGDRVIVYREKVTFQEGKTLALPVFLAKACYGSPCEYDGVTCYGAHYDGIAPGECSSYPQRQLEPVLTPGDESKWEFVPTSKPSIDAGRPSYPSDFDDYYDEDDEANPTPRFDGGLAVPGCSTPSASRNCAPGTPTLDASFSPLLDRQ